MTTVHRFGDCFAVTVKGAPELLLHPEAMSEDPGILARATAAATDLATDGLRVLAVATRTVARLPRDVQMRSGTFTCWAWSGSPTLPRRALGRRWPQYVAPGSGWSWYRRPSGDRQGHRTRCRAGRRRGGGG